MNNGALCEWVCFGRLLVRFATSLPKVVGHLSNGLLSKPTIISAEFATKIVII